MMRSIGLVARSVLIEAVRRKEIYTVVLVCCALMAFILMMDFWDLEGLTKFYREVVLKIMSIATALMAMLLAARQLPREFDQRTIYPLLARPLSRWAFVLGKLLGVFCAATFCFALFMAVYTLGSLRLGGSIPWGLFLQHIYLQLVMILLLSSLSFLLSLLMNFDAALSISVLFYIISATYTSMLTTLYEYADQTARIGLQVLNWVLPHLILFDLSAKTVHADKWSPLSFSIMAQLTLYGLTFTTIYLGLAQLLFRRRPL